MINCVDAMVEPPEWKILELHSVMSCKTCDCQSLGEHASVLMWFAWSDLPWAVRRAMALGADTSLTDKQGWNALHWAGLGGSIDCAKLLVRHNIDLLFEKTEDEETPQDIACKWGHCDLGLFLEEASRS